MHNKIIIEDKEIETRDIKFIPVGIFAHQSKLL